MADQLSFRYLAYNGHKPWMMTPNLDVLASRSMNFRRAYCSSPLCVPSRQSFYTGRTTRHTRCICDVRILTQPTLFGMLSDMRVPTFGVGKMDFRWDTDQLHGFTDRPGEEIGAQDIAPGVNNFSSFNGNTVRTIEREVDEQCEAITQVSLDCLSRRGRGLVYTSFLKPHESWDNGLWYDAPRRFFSLYGNHQFPTAKEAGYAANVSCLDHYVGECLKRADARGLLENTLVIFCSDHGEMAGTHGRWGKLCMFEEAIRVPLLVWHKDIIPQEIATPVALIDVFPTVFDWMGLECPVCDGASLLRERDNDYSIFIEYMDGQFWEGLHYDWDHQPIRYEDGISKVNRAIVRGWWKLVHNGTASMLFNVKTDEFTDLSRIHPRVMESLVEVLDSFPPEDVLDRSEFIS